MHTLEITKSCWQRPILRLMVVGALLVLCGCHGHFSISQPSPPPINPGEYSASDFTEDVKAYKAATTAGTADPNLAKQSRNNVAYGLMSQIDVVYGAYYNKLFSAKNTVAVSSDALTLGLSSAASIATNTATKTIFSALGTGFAGLGLSVDKNFFAQQTFPVIGVAMQTRRDKIRATIVANLALDTVEYPLLAAKRDLVAYLNAGTLASGLQELQEEAGTATSTATTNVGAAKGKPASPATLTAAGGNSQVSLLWTVSSGATSYNIYYATKTGVTPATGTKIPTITANSYTHSALTNGTAYYYVVTGVNANGESEASGEASAVPASPGAAVAGVSAAPATVTAAAGDSQVSLLWTASSGATAYNIYYATKAGVTPATGTKISTITANSYTHSPVTNGTTYYYVVTGVNASGESAASTEVSATPTTPKHANEIMKLTPHRF